MDKIREWFERGKDIVMKNLKYIAIGIPALMYILGFLATGFDKSYKGFNPNPIVAMQTLFSPYGRSLLFLLAVIPFAIWMIMTMRNAKYAGMQEDERGFYITSDGTYGTAEEMDKYRMKQKFHCVPEARAREAEGDILGIKDGQVLSRPAKSYHNRNVAAYGSSGSMKSRAIVRNKIIGCKRRGESMIVTDPKGELFRDTAKWLRKDGYNVRVLNLVSLDKSNGWNFMEDALQDCRGDGDELEVVEQMAHVIIQNTGGTAPGQQKDDFWDKGERGLLKAIMLYQYYTWKQGTNPLAFSWAYKFLLDNSVEKMKERFDALNRQMPMNAATSYFNIFLQAGERVCPNIHFGLLSRLSIFTNKNIQEITGKNEMDLELPAKEKCAYFVISPDQHSTYDFLVCLFFTLFFIRVVKYADTKTTSGACPVAVNLILDEFPSIGEIPDFAKKMATVRSRNVNITILFQSIPQLTERYPNPQHYGILSNCDYSVFLGTADPVTAEFISTRAGEATILVETEMENHNKFDPTHFTAERRESAGRGKRMIKTVDEVLMMAKDDPFAAMIIMRDQPVLMCQKFDYTRDPDSKDWEPFPMDEFDPHDPFWFDEKDAANVTPSALWESTGKPLRAERKDPVLSDEDDSEESTDEGSASEPPAPSIPDPADNTDPAANTSDRYVMRDSERHAANSILKQEAKIVQEAKAAEDNGEPTQPPVTGTPIRRGSVPLRNANRPTTSFKAGSGSSKPPEL